MKNDFILTIKSRGYWRVNFRPLSPPQQFTMQQCRELVRKNSVRLRGWPFPFFHEDKADHYAIENHSDYLAGWIDFGEKKEFWHMYQSGQFLHYAAVSEDWMGSKDSRQFSDKNLESGKYLNFVGSLIYYITEIMEFAVRLHGDGLYQEGVAVSISLHNTKNRELTSFDFDRLLSFPKKTAEDVIKFEQEYSPDKLQQKAAEIAIEPIVYFFEMFNFDNVSVDQVIRKDQETLYGYNADM